MALACSCSREASCQDESRSKSSCRRTCHWYCCNWTHLSKGVSSRNQKPSRKGPRTREASCQDESRSKSSCRRTCHWYCCNWTHLSKGVSSRNQKPSRKGPRTRERTCCH